MSLSTRLSQLILVIAVTSASAKMVEELASMNAQALQSKKEIFKACIDDSDCTDKGHGYACFQYICYPWEDDSEIDPKYRKMTCKSNDDCKGLTCHRHHDIRKIHKGVCMDQIIDCRENGKSDCKTGKNRQCCNSQYCCEDEYFNQLKQLPCVNHISCKDLGYGNYCCPQKPKGSSNTTTSICCNENPNPPRTTRRPYAPKASKVSGSPSVHATIALLALFLSFLVTLRRN